jgi:cyclopropane fatty-acyl-phospholipid synthase-like methyltransferase
MADTPVTPTPLAGWSDDAQVEWYVDRIGKLEARQAGEQMLADVMPPAPRRVLDLGCGDGRLAALALAERPSVEAIVAVDVSPPMLARARERFAYESRVEVRTWDLREPLTPLGTFDLIISGFAIHHLEDPRKQQLFAEAAAQLTRAGVFVNLEVVASATPQRHAEFLVAIGRTHDDPEDRLATIEDQLAWMRDAGMTNVDCVWRWRGFAVLVGEASHQSVADAARIS